MTSWLLALINDWVLYHIVEYFSHNGLIIAFKSFVRLIT